MCLPQLIRHRLLKCCHLNRLNEFFCACVASPDCHHVVVHLVYLSPVHENAKIFIFEIQSIIFIYVLISYRVLLGHATNFELFSHFDEINQVLIIYMYFTHVHKVQNRTQYLTFYTIDKEDGVTARIFLLIQTNLIDKQTIIHIQRFH